MRSVYIDIGLILMVHMTWFRSNGVFIITGISFSN